ncbi:MAG: YbbR-like domain-containing protein [Desulfovibrionaceae bacterium]|nr:YbbR-like domain-containing protein [Desulfovibrionaceae bacterium]
MKKQWQYVLLAVILAVFSWYLVSGREKVEAWVPMSVEMTSPREGLIVRDGMLTKIEVRVRGPKGLVRDLDKKKLTYPLDVSEIQVGENVLEIQRGRMPISMAFEVMEIKPNRVVLNVDQLIIKKVPVEASFKGRVDPDFDLVETRVSPGEVELKGPKTAFKGLDRLKVQVQADFPDKPQAHSAEVSLDVPDGVECIPPQVKVELVFAPKTKEVWLKVPLKLKIDGGWKAGLGQDSVRLLVKGPLALFRDSEFRKDIYALVRVEADDEPGKFEMEYEVELPEGCVVVRRNPVTVEVSIRAK